jgi:dienelactone hydrolase
MNPANRLLACAPLLMLVACAPALKLTPSDADVVLSRQILDAPDPTLTGPYKVLTLYYGSGTDKNRAIYRDSVAIRTPTVDVSKMVDLGRSAKQRNKYWGFTPKEMPLNARVWYPDGPGPYPLVLVVHGNHDMKDYSDPGYGYLGEMLASRGFIVASVDENFINGGIRGENDARGWFLLRHLKLFQRWNDEGGTPFQGKVDMGDIALIGHSRGGEAVEIAAAFNHLSHYPDDATLTFDFNFDIKGIVSIAPVDGQYLPTGRETVMKNVSYLVFHGSHDGDVSSFHGLRIYDRMKWTDGKFHFKAAAYVYRANHGQWNTVWQNKDDGPRSQRILDLRALLPQPDQRRFAKIYVSAFLEAVLRNDKRYLPIFRDNRVIGHWLPKTMYITRYETSAFRPLADFEEDIDVTTGTQSGVRIEADSMASWKEETLELRSRNRSNTSASQEDQAVFLGWNNRIAGPDTTRMGPPARYSLLLPEDLPADWGVDGSTTFDFQLGATNTMPPPRKDPTADTTKGSAGRKGGRVQAPRSKADKDAPKPPVDLSVEVEDAAGRTAKVDLRSYGPIRRPLETHVMRRADMDRELFAHPWELILQTYSIPLGDFTAANPALDLGSLKALRLVFDKSVAGEVAVDEMGLSPHLDPAFLSARVNGR